MELFYTAGKLTPKNSGRDSRGFMDLFGTRTFIRSEPHLTLTDSSYSPFMPETCFLMQSVSQSSPPMATYSGNGSITRITGLMLMQMGAFLLPRWNSAKIPTLRAPRWRPGVPLELGTLTVSGSMLGTAPSCTIYGLRIA